MTLANVFWGQGVLIGFFNDALTGHQLSLKKSYSYSLGVMRYRLVTMSNFLKCQQDFVLGKNSCCSHEAAAPPCPPRSDFLGFLGFTLTARQDCCCCVPDSSTVPDKYGHPSHCCYLHRQLHPPTPSPRDENSLSPQPRRFSR